MRRDFHSVFYAPHRGLSDYTLYFSGAGSAVRMNHVRRSRSAGGYLRLSLYVLFLGRARGSSPLSAPPLRKRCVCVCSVLNTGWDAEHPFGIHWWAVLGIGWPLFRANLRIHRSRRPWYTVRRILRGSCTQSPDPAVNAAPVGATILPTLFRPCYLEGPPRSALAANGILPQITGDLIPGLVIA